MKCILISYYFAPANLIGAVRFSKLLKYLSCADFEFEAVASLNNKIEFLPDGVRYDSILANDIAEKKVHRVKHSLIYRFLSSIVRMLFLASSAALNILSFPKSSISNKNVVSLPDKEKSFFSFLTYLKLKLLNFLIILRKSFFYILSFIQDLDFALMCFLDKELMNSVKESDVIVSTYGPFSSHLFCILYKLFYRKHAVKWIADFRDPMSQPTDPVFIRKLNKYLQNYVVKHSDRVVCVSEGYARSIVTKEYLEKLHIIHNGYDDSDLSYIDIKCNNSFYGDKFIISYTGTLYSGRRDITPLLRALNNIFNDDISIKELVRFVYAGPESKFVNNLFDCLGLKEILIDFGMVSREESLSISASSDLLLVSTWDNPEHLGVLPGKLYELMMFNIPILCLVDTKSGNSEIRNIINDYKLGFCYESTDYNISTLELYLKNLVLRIPSSNYNLSTKFFSYKEISRRYLEVIKNL